MLLLWLALHTGVTPNNQASLQFETVAAPLASLSTLTEHLPSATRSEAKEDRRWNR